MVRGLYTAYTGMLHQQHRLDTITNNLANSATVGFKKEGATAKAFDDVFAIKLKDSSEHYYARGVGSMNLGVKIGENYTDYGQGSLRTTDNTFDLAIAGDGFFAITFKSKTSGEETVRYTRNGSFTLNKEGYLVTEDGDFVQGPDGDIQIETGVDTTIDKSGAIIQHGEVVAQIAIDDFADYDYLKKYGENMFIAVDGAEIIPSNASIEQGVIEMSNVNVINEMVEMITISRAYEANQKFVQTADDTLSKDVTLGAL